MQHFDLFIIGAGSGGVRAARKSSELGAKVAIAENRFLGGTCVNVGCVPKKLFVYAAEYADHNRIAADFGWQIDAKFDWQILRTNKDSQIKRLNDVYRNILTNNDVTIFDNKAMMAGENMIALDSGERITADKILIATGGKPIRPTVTGGEHCLISDDLFSLPALPKKILIIGGGYIGTEFACILNGLGVQVTQNMRETSSFLRHFDDEISEHLKEILTLSGIDHLYGEIDKIEKQDSINVTFADGTIWQGDAVLAAMGREANFDQLALDKVGITPNNKGFIDVDAHFQTQNPHLYAIGDCIGTEALTPIAIRQAMLFAYQQFGKKPCPVAAINPDSIPKAVFSLPPIGTVGLTQKQALQRHKTIRIYRSEFRPMKSSLGEYTDKKRNEKILMKLIINDTDDKIVGCHIVGADAPEIIQLMATLIQQGITKSALDDTVALHPSNAEELVTMLGAPEIITADGG